MRGKDQGIVGTIYIPKNSDDMPDRLVLEYEGKD
jgi:hypothetical protein